MRPHERRERGAYPYFKLATWDGVNMMWRAGKRVYETEAAARASASRSGRYRISRADESGYVEMAPFEVVA
jgi:hypothetical protein